jgi:hypothetical protein
MVISDPSWDDYVDVPRWVTPQSTRAAAQRDGINACAQSWRASSDPAPPRSQTFPRFVEAEISWIPGSSILSS